MVAPQPHFYHPSAAYDVTAVPRFRSIHRYLGAPGGVDSVVCDLLYLNKRIGSQLRYWLNVIFG